jgi:hypothetical protein
MRATSFVLASFCILLALLAIAFVCPLLGDPMLVNIARSFCALVGVVALLFMSQINRLRHG